MADAHSIFLKVMAPSLSEESEELHHSPRKSNQTPHKNRLLSEKRISGRENNKQNGINDSSSGGKTPWYAPAYGSSPQITAIKKRTENKQISCLYTLGV